MHSKKFLSFLLTVLLLSGCVTPAAEKPVETVSETVPAAAESTAATAEEPAETTENPEAMNVPETTSAEPEETVSEADGDALLAEWMEHIWGFREENKPTESENPTLAEEIYRLLFDFAELDHYLYYCGRTGIYGRILNEESGEYRDLLPPNDDMIVIDKPHINSRDEIESDDELFVINNTVYYSRIRYGEIKTLDEYCRRMSAVATWEYMELDCPWLGKRILSSEGNLYMSDFAATMGASPFADLSLKKIAKIDEDTLRLEFTAAEYYTETRIESRDFSITISKGKSFAEGRKPDGKWRVDRCDWENISDLRDEIFRGGINGQNPKTDLPEQIERCLKESGLM